MLCANLYRLVQWFVAAAMVASLTGCCASPYRAWQNAYGFEDPQTEHFRPGPRPPKTTPPGPTTSAIVNIATPAGS
jgi:hypothetical protein